MDHAEINSPALNLVDKIRRLVPPLKSAKGAGRVKTRLQCVIGQRKIQMPWKGCAAIGLQALIAAIKGPTPRMAMTRLRL